jgi:TP901 family phage tail tape measure protein
MADETIRITVDSSGAEAGTKRVNRSLKTLQKESKESSRDVDRLRKSFQRSGKQAKTFGTDIKSSATSLASFGRTILGPLGIVVGLASIARAFGSVIETGQKFEKAVAELSAITGASGTELKALSDEARNLGKTTTQSAIQVATGFKLIASAKPELLENQEALIGVTKEAITLAEASGLTLPEAVKALTGSLNQFNAPAEEAGRFINVLAAGSKLGAVEIPQLTEALKVSGTVASSAGLSFEQTIAALEVLGEAELKGAEGGTAFRNIILGLTKQNLPELEVRAFGVAGALENLNLHVLKGLTPLERDNKLLKIFGRESLAAAQALLVRTERQRQLTDAVTGTTTAQEQALIATDTLEDDLLRLDNAFEGLQLALSDGVIPSTRGATRLLTDYLNVMSDGLDDINAFATALGEDLGGAFRTNEGILKSLTEATAKEVGEQIKIQEKFIENQKKFGKASLLPFSFGILEALDKGTLRDAELQLANLKTLQDELNGIKVDTKDTNADGTPTGTGGESDADKRKRERAERNAALKTKQELEKEGREQEKLGSQIVRDATKDIKNQANALRDIQDQLNPTNAATREYFEDLQVLNRALQEGTIDTKEWENANKQLSEEFEEQKKELLGLNDVTEKRNEILERQADLLDTVKNRTENFIEVESDLQALLKSEQITLDEFGVAMDDLRGRQLAASTDLADGFERGFRSAEESFNDFASTSEKITVEVFGGMQDGLANFAKTGKADFNSLKNTIIDGLVELGSQAALSELFSSAGEDGKGGGLFTQLLGAGVKAFTGTDTPSMGDGGIQNTRTLAEIAEKGPEAVIPLKGGSVPVKITDTAKPTLNIQNKFIITTPDPGSFGRSQSQIELMLGQTIQRAVARNG